MRDPGNEVENGYPVMVQIMTAKTMTLQSLYVHAVINSVMFPQLFYDIVLYARHFLPVKVFPKTATTKCNVDR